MSNVEYGASRLFDVRDSLYKRERRSPLNICLNVIIVLFCAILVLELSFNVLYTGIYVIDESMTPTIIGAPASNRSGGEFIYIDKYAKPNRGDIVVVYRETPDGTKGNIIKRVVALGGDTIELYKGVLKVNGEVVDEYYLDENYNSPENEYNTLPEHHTVVEGGMFLLGDNRNVSNDSRQNGDYPVENLVGVVPKWSMKIKPMTTKFYTFFNFTLWGK
ncbi:MAG: signal peptidase I [Clostridia bacterium]|nr:signal peptidase I [Clostridia bacterium]